MSNWLTRQFNLDQFPGPQSSINPSSSSLRRLRRSRQQPHSNVASSSASVAPVQRNARPATIPGSSRPETPPPSYSTAFPDGPPPEFLRAIEASQQPTQTNQNQQARSIPVFAHYNIGVDPALFTTTRIDTKGCPYFYIVLPRQNSQGVSSSTPMRPTRHASTQTGPMPALHFDRDTDDLEVGSYTSPLLHQLPRSSPEFIDGACAFSPSTRFFEIGEDITSNLSLVRPKPACSQPTHSQL